MDVNLCNYPERKINWCTESWTGAGSFASRVMSATHFADFQSRLLSQCMLGYAGETHCRNLQDQCDTTLDSVSNRYNLTTQFKNNQYIFTHTFTIWTELSSSQSGFLSDAVIDCLSAPTEDERCMITGTRLKHYHPFAWPLSFLMSVMQMSLESKLFWWGEDLRVSDVPPPRSLDWHLSSTLVDISPGGVEMSEVNWEESTAQ